MHTGCTRDFPVYLRCTSGVHPVYMLWEPLRPDGFAEGSRRGAGRRRVFDSDYEDDDEDEDDMRIAPSVKPGTLAALAGLSLMQPCAPCLAVGNGL
jgi:hypothetical protein